MASASPLAGLLSGSCRWFCAGSLPHLDARAAVRFILDRAHILPFWPELPQRGLGEAILPKAMRAFEKDWEGYREDEASGLYALREELAGQRRKLPIIKCQLPGPLTALIYGRRQVEVRAFELEEAAQACLKVIVWQAGFLSEVADRLLFVIDEPGIFHSPPLSVAQRRLVAETFSYLFVAVHERGHFLGLHCCDSFEAGLLELPFDLLSFDALSRGLGVFFTESAALAWKSALRNGLLAVPGTFPAVVMRDHEAARRRGIEIHQDFCLRLRELACSEAELLMSADCGHAGASLEWVERLYQK